MGRVARLKAEPGGVTLSTRRGRATITASKTKTGIATGCSAKAFIRRPSSGLLPGICTASSGDFVMPRYAELEVTTNFTFLAGGSHPEELVATAKALGLAAIAVTDRNTLAGAVRAHIAAKEAGIKFIVGARLDLQDAPSLLAYPTDRAAYGRLCRLLTLGQRRAEKGQCTLFLDDVAAHAEGLIFIVVPPDDFPSHSPMSSLGLTGRSSNHGSLGNEGQELLDARLREHDEGNFESQLRRIKQALGEKTPLYLAARHSYRGDDRAQIGRA